MKRGDRKRGPEGGCAGEWAGTRPETDFRREMESKRAGSGDGNPGGLGHLGGWIAQWLFELY